MRKKLELQQSTTKEAVKAGPSDYPQVSYSCVLLP